MVKEQQLKKGSLIRFGFLYQKYKLTKYIILQQTKLLTLSNKQTSSRIYLIKYNNIFQ